MKPSDRRPLGKSGLEVTIASYGGGSVGNFGRRITNAEAAAILDAAWEAGIRYFDTAPFYGRGRSERRIGAFLSEKPRDEFVLSSKVGRLLRPAPGGAEEDGLFLDPALRSLLGLFLRRGDAELRIQPAPPRP
jgi:D-threo-aldose 1-dehydrogenase